MNSIYLRDTFFRSTKIWLAGMLSILVAEALDLHFSVSAGIVAILSVASTKKETLKTIINRFCTFSIAMITAFCMYTIFGFHIEAFLMFFGVFILICNYFKWESAIAINSVLASHFLTFQKITYHTLINEFLLFLIGSIFAIGVNLHLHKKTEYITSLKTETDEQIRIVLERMSIKIATEGTKVYNDERFKKLDKSISIAKNIALENYMNSFLKASKTDIEYLIMREKQIKVLHVIYTYILKIKSITSTTQHVSKYLKRVSMNFNMGNSAVELLNELYTLMDELKNSELPKTREEFEDRALLYLILNHMEEFLILKLTYHRMVQGQ